MKSTIIVACLSIGGICGYVIRDRIPNEPPQVKILIEPISPPKSSGLKYDVPSCCIPKDFVIQLPTIQPTL